MELITANKKNSGKFDVTKIASKLKAKNKTTGEEEERQFIDEREINIQMNIGLQEQSDGSYKFIQNDVEAGEIYSNCPSNLVQFVKGYADKYDKFPGGNITVTYYDTTKEPIIQSQGAASVSYNRARLYTYPYTNFRTQYNAKAKEAKGGTGQFSLDISSFNFKVKSQGSVDLIPSSSYLKVQDAEESPTQTRAGYLIFVKKLPDMTGVTVDSSDTYPIDVGYISDDGFVSNEYYYCFMTSDQKTRGTPIPFSEIEYNGQIFGRVNFSVRQSNDEETEYVISAINFILHGYGKLYYNIAEMATFYLQGYHKTGDTLSGVTIHSEHEGPTTIARNSSGVATTITNTVFEFQLSYEKESEEEDPTLGLQFLKYEKIQELTYDSGAYQATISYAGINEQSLTDTQEVPINPNYMYPDESLKLPDIL